MEIENLKKEKEDLNSKINIVINQNDIMNNEILNLNNQIKDLELKTIICVQFRSIHEDIDFAILCKTTDIFVRLEEQLYERYPDLKETNNYFTCNGNVIEKSKTLEENKIRNSDKIILNKE